MEMMSTNTHTISGPSGMDVRRYGRLLAKFTPKVIETAAENQEALAVVEALLERGEANLNSEEIALLDLLGTLIEKFEHAAYELPEGDPAGALEVLMQGRELKPIDLAGVLGSRSRVSEILSRRRSISKDQAKSLGAFFGVSPARVHLIVIGSAAAREDAANVPASYRTFLHAQLWPIRSLVSEAQYKCLGSPFDLHSAAVIVKRVLQVIRRSVLKTIWEDNKNLVIGKSRRESKSNQALMFAPTHTGHFPNHEWAARPCAVAVGRQGKSAWSSFASRRSTLERLCQPSRLRQDRSSP